MGKKKENIKEKASLTPSLRAFFRSGLSLEGRKSGLRKSGNDSVARMMHQREKWAQNQQGRWQDKMAAGQLLDGFPATKEGGQHRRKDGKQRH